MLSADEIARLAERAGLRRDDGSRGWRARRAWRRLVSACAAGDAAAQEAVQTMELTDTDVLGLLAAAPAEPAARAVYLVLIGQGAQHQALDPDGSLLTLAYRAAVPEVRERLRAYLAAEGGTEVIRVVVTGEQRDRLAEMSYDELDHLGHHLAERRSWDELRRLVLDLPLAKASAAARLLPAGERGAGAAEVLSDPSVPSPGQLRALAERLPRRRLIRHDFVGSYQGASFSPDASELALQYSRPTPWSTDVHAEILRIGTGKVTRHFTRHIVTGPVGGNSILHLGDEILVRGETSKHLRQIIRIFPERETVGPPAPVSVMRRSSGGAVMLCPEGFAFADRHAQDLRYLTMPQFGENGAYGRLSHEGVFGGLTTLPTARLVAFCTREHAFVADEDGDLLRAMTMPRESVRFDPALSFFSPDSLAVHHKAARPEHPVTHVWEFRPDGTLRDTARHWGPIRNGFLPHGWRSSLVLDDAFAERIHAVDGSWVDNGAHWLQLDAKTASGRARRALIALSPGQDMYVTEVSRGRQAVEVHSPHLSSARELLERPLLHATPSDLHLIRELRSKIGAPDVRAALGLLSACLTDRFGGDIALGATGSSPFGGPHDIALGEDGNR
ncbi:hypothetical protein OG800_47560 [Streptomyces sp. NBC_00445]|uniref:hypothetical protein n=1 Tax=Streptomyces sp. NBC_00445 TaxID=2975745 RepID=UPI002E1EE121